MKNRMRLLRMLVLFLLLLRGPVGGHAQTSAFNENEVKAVFLLNFTQFVQWPPQVFPDAQKPITIGILGKDPFGKLLEEIVRDEVVNKRKLVIQHYRRVEEITSCH